MIKDKKTPAPQGPSDALSKLIEAAKEKLEAMWEGNHSQHLQSPLSNPPQKGKQNRDHLH